MTQKELFKFHLKKNFLSLRCALFVLLTVALFFVYLVPQIEFIFQFAKMHNLNENWILQSLSDNLAISIFSFFNSFLSFIIPIFVSLSVAQEIEKGITATYLTFPITRKQYLVSKIVGDLIFLFILVFTPIPAIMLYTYGLHHIMYFNYAFFVSYIITAVYIILFGYFFVLSISISLPYVSTSLITSILIFFSWNTIFSYLANLTGIHSVFQVESFTNYGIQFITIYLYYALKEKTEPQMLFEYLPYAINNVLILSILGVISCIIVFYLFLTRDFTEI